MDLEANIVEQRSYAGFFARSFIFVFVGFTSSARGMMEEFCVRRKVGCHREAVDISYGCDSGGKARPAYFRLRPESSLSTSASVVIGIMGSIGDRTKPCLS
jgi:hypothetical protein